MQALWLEEGELSWRDNVAQPVPQAGEALVRVLRAGICNTDVELLRGYCPFTGVLGHEFVGMVEEGQVLRGQRVVGEINAVCGSCTACLNGRRSHCERRTVLGIVGRDGAFAEYLVLPEENLHAVPQCVATDAATFVEPLAAALQILQQVQVRPADRVLVVGDGKLGQLIAQTLALTGCDLCAVGRHSNKLERLAGFGIDVGQAKEVEAKAYDLAIECTGNAAGFDLAQRALRPRGTLVLKSTYAGDLTFNAASLVVDEIQLVGSRCGPFAPALRLLEKGEVEVESLIDRHYPLSEGLVAFSRAQEAGVLKVLLDIGDE